MTTISFAEFVLDTTNQTLRKATAEPIQLNWKTCEVLKVLLEHANEVVTRQQLIDEVWQSNYLVGDKALSTIIWQLRKYLDDSGIQIQTQPKTGYTLIISNQIDSKQSTQPDPTSSENLKPKQNITRYHVLASVAIVCALLLFWSKYQPIDKHNPIAPQMIVLKSIQSDKPIAHQFINRLEQAIPSKTGLKLVEGDVKQAIIASQNKMIAAAEYHIQTLLLIEITDVSEAQMRLSVRVSDTDTQHFETASWTIEAGSLMDLELPLISLLPAQQWQ